MEKELLELFESVKRAADAASADGGGESSPEEDRCLDGLKRLRKFPVNYHVLVSTQVGKRLRHLTKHPRKKIQSSATELVDIWKNIVIKETMKNKKNEDSENKHSMEPEPAKILQKSNSIRVEKVAKLEKPTSVKVASGPSKSETVKIEKKVETFERVTVKSENKPAPSSVGPPKLTSIIYCKDALRDKVRELLSEALCKVSSEVDDDLRDEMKECDPYRVAVLVETAMFEKWGKSNGAQKFKYRSIMFNIKDPNNPDFRRKVLLGQFRPESVPHLTPEDMASDHRQQQNEKIKEKALFDCQRGAAPKATTDQFKCGRCGKRQCTYYQLQTRSADEPMTTFVTCVNCNNHWKFC